MIAFALLTAAATYVFAASNVVGESGAGQGAGSIAGYTISNVAYTLDVTSPQTISQATFTLNAPPGSAKTVRAKLGSAGYQACSLSGSTATTSTWACTLSGVTTANLSPATLRVVAAQ